MKVVIIAFSALLIAGILGYVGFTVYSSVRLGLDNAAGGSEAAKPPITKVGEHPLAMPLQCLVRAERRLRDSHARYTSWVDPASGPTCSERHVYGLLKLYDDVPGICEQGANVARALGKSELAERLADMGATYAVLLRAAVPAQAYYESKGYEADACAQGKALHSDLMKGFDGALHAVGQLRARVDTDASEYRAVARELLRSKHGHRSRQEALLDYLYVLDELAALFLDGVIAEDEMEAFARQTDRCASGHVALLQKHKKTPFSKATGKFLNSATKLAKTCRMAKVRHMSEKRLTDAEYGRMEQQLRALLRDVRKVDDIPPPAMLYAF